MANVLYGHKNTHKLNMKNIIQHTLSVKMGVKIFVSRRYAKRSYSNKKSIEKCKIDYKSKKADAVKLESNNSNFKIIELLVKKNIPVMGHIDYTPQFKKNLKLRVFLKKKLTLIKRSRVYWKAGAFSIVLECLTTHAARLISSKISIPTIGIGSSSYCDGQILVTDDMIGLVDFTLNLSKNMQI